MTRARPTLTLLLLFVAALLTACGGEGSNSIACAWEESVKRCSGGGFGPYEERCMTIEDPREGYTAQDHCNTIRSLDVVCESTCCNQYRQRSFQPIDGACPGGDR